MNLIDIENQESDLNTSHPCELIFDNVEEDDDDNYGFTDLTLDEPINEKEHIFNSKKHLIENLEEEGFLPKEDNSSAYNPLDDKIWEVANAFIDYYGPISSQLFGYNTALETMRDQISEKGLISLEHDGNTHTVTWSNLHFQKPVHKEVNEDIVRITPKMCMDRSLSYMSSAYVDITYTGPNQTNTYIKKYIGDIPVMVHSDLCYLKDF